MARIFVIKCNFIFCVCVCVCGLVDGRHTSVQLLLMNLPGSHFNQILFMCCITFLLHGANICNMQFQVISVLMTPIYYNIRNVNVLCKHELVLVSLNRIYAFLIIALVTCTATWYPQCCNKF
jgi:hypothetical protein